MNLGPDAFTGPYKFRKLGDGPWAHTEWTSGVEPEAPAMVIDQMPVVENFARQEAENNMDVDPPVPVQDGREVHAADPMPMDPEPGPNPAPNAHDDGHQQGGIARNLWSKRWTRRDDGSWFYTFKRRAVA